MRQYNVDLEFDDDTGEPTNFVTEDGKLSWAYEFVEMADWKDVDDQTKAFIKVKALSPSHDVVILFDGSDTMIYASMGMVACRNKEM